MADVFALVLPLFGLIILGFGAGKTSSQPLAALGWLNTFVIYFALPALFFALVAKTPVEKLASWDFVGIQVGVTFVVFAVGVLLGLIASRGKLDEAAIQGFGSAYGNIGYMGPALAILSLGPAAAVPVALISVFENIMHFIMAPTLMALANPGRTRILALVFGIVRKVVTHPFVVSTAAGVAVAVSGVELPVALDRLLAYLSQAAAPCALFAMGVTLALSPLNRVPPSLAFIVPLKLVVHPLLMYVAMTSVGGIDPVWVYTAVLLAALPTATNVFVIAQQYEVWVNRASAAILLTTTLSLVTVTALLVAIKTGAIPVDEAVVPFGFAPNFQLVIPDAQ
ncbi:MAG: AEC family transporter [Hyphomicrobiaceae bacterium]